MGKEGWNVRKGGVKGKLCSREGLAEGKPKVVTKGRDR